MELQRYMAVGFLTISMLIMLNDGLDIPDRVKKIAKKIHKKCQEETNTSDEFLKLTKQRILPRDNHYACYLHCTFSTGGLMDENNVISLQNLIDFMPEEIHPLINKLVNTCGTQDGSEKCEIALNTAQCYVNTSPDMLMEAFDFLFD
ncbi:general odorant-binding protein 69a-like [Haematobia irritans]|uniref:general odorant-binding protein 69a-like n=1 Tax=Haematobia irritans TaxID=7368 RepID=UPI003F4F9D44